MLKPFAGLPAAIASVITPMSSKISRVRGITTSAREVMGGMGERDPGRLPDRAVRAVAADDPPASHGFNRSVMATKPCGHGIGVLGQIGQRPPALDLDAPLGQGRGERTAWSAPAG
jgi:hypothetical protein